MLYLNQGETGMKLAKIDKVENCVCEKMTYADIQNVLSGTTSDMIRLMKSKNGVGLAAPQVGILKRFFIMKYKDDYIKCFNPEIIYLSPQKSAMKEGCLTYPQQIHGVVNIMRPKTIQVKYTNENNHEVTLRLRGFDSKVFQHELDHLNGLTIFYRG